MYSVPYARGTHGVRRAGRHARDRLALEDLPPLADPPPPSRQALAHPINSTVAARAGQAGQQGDASSSPTPPAPAPTTCWSPRSCASWRSAGVRDEDITLLCAIGLHRPSTLEERVEKLGQAVVDRYRVIDSAPRDPERVVDLGAGPNGVRMSVSATAYEADLLIATGVVEPHQYAGYSGGRKTVAIGAAGEQTIEYTHGPQMLDHPGTRLGRLEGNPFHEAITEAAQRAGLRFILNVVLDDDKRIVAVRAGEPTAAFERAGRHRPRDVRSADPAPVRRRDRRRGVSQGQQPVPGVARAPATCSSRRRRSSEPAGTSSSPRGRRKAPVRASASSASFRPCARPPACSASWTTRAPRLQAGRSASVRHGQGAGGREGHHRRLRVPGHRPRSADDPGRDDG